MKYCNICNYLINEKGEDSIEDCEYCAELNKSLEEEESWPEPAEWKPRFSLSQHEKPFGSTRESSYEERVRKEEELEEDDAHRRFMKKFGW